MANPYLPSWEYIPDGEPHLFDGRVYIYGSHDRFGGHGYCLNDYVCWSAPENDLAAWRYEGVIYTRGDDPCNADGDKVLFAPDVTRGPDGRYYLYYMLDPFLPPERPRLSVAVCEKPAGRYQFLGYVRYADGTLLGTREEDGFHFDPAVFTQGQRTYLYTGFCPRDTKAKGSMVSVLDSDMLTLIEEPKTLIPSAPFAAGTSFADAPFFEASSVRKIKDTYYFIYSSIEHHPLCYATSNSPTEGFVYRGVLVSNADLGIAHGKKAPKSTFYGGNNHGSIVQANGEWYVFYHRHTNGTNFSRQGCIERLTLGADGTFAQAEMTSVGASAPFPARGTYPACLACTLFCETDCLTTGSPGEWMDCRFPKITQDISDVPPGETADTDGIIANLRHGAVAGFKWFDCENVTHLSVTTRGICNGTFAVSTALDGPVIGTIAVHHTNDWRTHTAAIAMPNGIHALYLRYEGSGYVSMQNITFTTDK